MNQSITDLESLENIGLTIAEDKIYFRSFDGMYVLESNGEHNLIENTYYTHNIGSIEKLNHKKLLLFRSAIDTSGYPCTVYTSHYTSVYDIETQSEGYIKILSE